MQMKKWTAAAIGAVLAVGAAGAAVAHHSFATEFDRNKPIRLEGKVVKFEWVNPHSWIHIDATVNGRVQRWRVEGGAPSALLRRGWNRNSLPAGTEIIVDAFRARDGDTRASAAEIRFPNGRELSLGNPTTEAVAAAARRAAATKPNPARHPASETEGARDRSIAGPFLFGAGRLPASLSRRGNKTVVFTVVCHRACRQGWGILNAASA